MHGIPIESEVEQLKQLARAAQITWFENPTSLEAKVEYAMRLRHWGKKAGRKLAVAQALKLEAEVEAARAQSIQPNH